DAQYSLPATSCTLSRTVASRRAPASATPSDCCYDSACGSRSANPAATSVGAARHDGGASMADDELELIDGNEATRRLVETGMLAGCALSEADLAELEISAAQLTDCRFVDVSLRAAQLAGLRATRVTFIRCRLDEADLAGAELIACAFFDAETEQGCD